MIKRCICIRRRIFLFYSSDIHGNSITRRRMDIFRRLIEGEACTIILTVDALFDRMPDLSYIKKKCGDDP